MNKLWSRIKVHKILDCPLEDNWKTCKCHDCGKYGFSCFWSEMEKASQDALASYITTQPWEIVSMFVIVILMFMICGFFLSTTPTNLNVGF